MKRWILGAVILAVALIGFTYASRTKPANADPQPLIKFDGHNVTYAQNIPDCH